MAVRCWQGDGDIELSYDPVQEPRGGSQMLPGRHGDIELSYDPTQELRGWLARAIYF